MTFSNDNGQVLEVAGAISMTKKAVSFFNGEIKGDFSLNFLVDNNSQNRKILNYNGPKMLNQVAFTKQAFTLMRFGNPYMRGYIVIQSEDGNKLNCYFVSGNSNWIQLLNGLINKLDWNGYNTTYDYTAIQASWTATTGVVFPMVDWNYNLKKGRTDYWPGDVIIDSRNDRDNFHLNDFYPCLYLSSLMTEIFQQNGMKLAGNLLNDPTYQSIVVTPTNGQMKRAVFKNVYAVGSSQSIGAGLTSKYTSFSEVSDPDNLFANNSYTANKSTMVKVSVTVNTISVGWQIWKNGAFLVSFNPVGTPLKDRYEIICTAGDVIEIYAFNPSGAPVSVSVDILFEVPSWVKYRDIVNPSNFLPSLSCMDMVKGIINLFGCVCYFDEYSKTLTANIVEKIKPESAEDWSAYYLSHRSEYTVSQAKNNYIKLQPATDGDIKVYNDSHLIGFGEGNIITRNTLKDEGTIATLPFKSSACGIGLNSVFSANIPLANLVDQGDPVTFTGITAFAGSIWDFQYTTPSDGPAFRAGEIVRIVNSAGISLGYFQVFGEVGGAPSTAVEIYFAITATTFSGKIFRQNITYQEVGCRLLAVKPSTSIVDFSTASSFTYYQESPYPTTPSWGGTSSVSTTMFASFTKAQIADAIDAWKINLAIDNPDSGGYNDPSMKQLFFNKITSFLQNPDIRLQAQLPESVFQKFDFSGFIYIKAEKIDGYFFVDSIVNYKDSTVPVEVNVYML